MSKESENLEKLGQGLNRIITSAYLTFIDLMGDERVVLNLWVKRWTNLLIDELEEKHKIHLKAKNPNEAVNLFLNVSNKYKYLHEIGNFKVVKTERGLLVEIPSCPFDIVQRTVINKNVKKAGFSGDVELGCWRAISLIAAIERISEEKISQITYTVSPKHLTGNSCKIELRFRES
jgi:hypothetical protein